MLRAESSTAEAGSSDLAPIVIGRNMQGRVIPYAKSLGADWYKGAPEGMPKSEWLAHNEEWLRERMAEGRNVIDIGDDPATLLASPNYDMEHRVLFEGEGYPNYDQHWLDNLEGLRYQQATAH